MSAGTRSLNWKDFWKLKRVDKDLGEILVDQCTVSVFSKPSVIRCSYESRSNSSVYATCTSDMIYPPAMCEFCLLDDEKTECSVSHYEHTQLTHEPIYYNSICGVSLPTSNVSFYKVMATIFPNMTGSTVDIIYGTNLTLSAGKRNSGQSPALNCSVNVDKYFRHECKCQLPKDDENSNFNSLGKTDFKESMEVPLESRYTISVDDQSIQCSQFDRSIASRSANLS
ncbi:hypothetical protein Btru_062935 [Bulinus truncatus]|nr:hypothetical protein Btru_062935 [Bulinus truncatus]